MKSEPWLSWPCLQLGIWVRGSPGLCGCSGSGRHFQLWTPPSINPSKLSSARSAHTGTPPQASFLKCGSLDRSLTFLLIKGEWARGGDYISASEQPAEISSGSQTEALVGQPTPHQVL